MRVAEQLVYLARLHGMGRPAAAAAAHEWTERLGLAGRRADEVQQLSHGNQQRVQLAAALVSRPRILVLDVPFSGLDPVAVDVMSTVLRDQADAGIPVLFSSHQLDLVERICDRVGIVAAGAMVAGGPVDELRAGGPERLVVSAPHAPPGWADTVPGVVTARYEANRTALELGQPAPTTRSSLRPPWRPGRCMSSSAAGPR
jgi:ABC-2 type transport system ATP-binding protein